MLPRSETTKHVIRIAGQMDMAGQARREAADAAMERYARGDDAAFGALYDALSPMLFGFLRRQSCAVERAEDLLQQTLLHMHTARGHSRAGASVVAWAFAIAHRLHIDALRRDRLTHPAGAGAPSSSPSGEEVAVGQQLAAVLSRRISALPEAQRVAFSLVCIEGLSNGEVAEVLGLTRLAVKLRIFRAREALRDVLGGLDERT